MDEGADQPREPLPELRADRLVKHNAFKAGLGSETVYNRLRRGWQFSEIFLPIQKKGRKHKYFYHGMPIKEYCKEIGLRYGTFIMRIKRGWSIRQALGK